MNDDIPLISVIVPIYNVAPYLRKCLESLKKQTMREIEVICIDDGSTDISGKIAEEYRSEEWPVFRVIHTENRGLSAARNRGIEEAKAEWIMFVDSDDWVEPGFCERPYKAAIENQADMVIFQKDIQKNGQIIKKKKSKRPEGFIDEFNAHEFGGVMAWNKLYKKELFSEIRYPKGRVSEDVSTTHKLVHASDHILYLNECLYHRIYRKDSISHTHTINNQKDFFRSAIERNNDMISYGYATGFHESLLCIGALGLLSVMRPCDDDMYKEAEKTIDSFAAIPKRLNSKQRIAMWAWQRNRRVFLLLARVTGRLKE